MMKFLLMGLLLPLAAATPETPEKTAPKTVTVFALTVSGGG